MESHSKLKHIVFSQTMGPIQVKFHVKTPYAYDRLATIHTKYFGHLTKMTAMPKYGKNPFKNSSITEPEDLGLSV